MASSLAVIFPAIAAASGPCSAAQSTNSLYVLTTSSFETFVANSLSASSTDFLTEPVPVPFSVAISVLFVFTCVWSSDSAASVAMPSVFLLTYSTTVVASVPSGREPTRSFTLVTSPSV